MSIMLKSLCENADYRYGLNVVAGQKGMSNVVQWIHTVEDVEVSDFLHGGELIFTTGIANKNNEWLLPFVKNLKNKNVSGLIVNIGPYITSVPQQVLDYCNKLNFPLMTIPWKTRIVDISRDFCNKIITNEKEEEDVCEAFKNIVFFPSDAEKYIPVLKSHNFDTDKDYCMIAVKTEVNNISTHDMVDELYERFLYSYKKQWGSFTVGFVTYYVLCDFTDNELETLVSNIQAQQFNKLYIERIYVVVGLKNSSLTKLYKNYQITSRLLDVAVKKNISPEWYDKLGMKKILLAVDDIEILRRFYNDNLSALKKYDEDNGTDYMGFLKKYLKYDGSIQKVADETFVHRNTINYQLAKVKKILNNNLKSYEDRLNLILAFYIEAII